MVRFFKRLSMKVSSKNAEIKFIRQKHRWDCAHTCLNMLKYDSYSIFPEKDGINTDHILNKILFSKKLDLYENREKSFYDNPILITVRTSFQDNVSHLILGYLDKIYDPLYRKGIYWAEKYMKTQRVQEMLEVPFKS